MKKLIRFVIFVVLAIVLLAPSGSREKAKEIFNGLGLNELSQNRFEDKKGDLKVHFIDVGQGDSTFIEFPNGETMLIDAGEWTEAEKVIDYINKCGANKIDYLIVTHPHSDHIGGLSYVINEFETGKMYMPKVSHQTKTFENLLDAIEENDLPVFSAKEGVVICENEQLKIQIIAPVSDGYESLNDYSAVIRLDYGETSFLFMGDAEQISENEIEADVNVDVYKVGHHGSKTSSSKEFLYRVMPEIAVISVGEDNDYGHPSKPVLTRLNEIGAKILRTDECGDIVIQSDGINIFTKED